MKKKSKRALTPKLRFPEFRNKGEWEEKPLEQIAGRITAKNLDGRVTRVLTNSAEHGVVDQRDYFDKDIANASNIDGYYIVDFGDYVYNPRISTLAPVGPISRNNIGKGVMSPLYTVFRFAEENTDFYQHYFKAASWYSYLRRVSSMGARHDRMSITTGDFMAMPVPTPQEQEQQKIADCLSSLDDLITAEADRLEALQTHKKGLMQQLFPREGETTPRLRFPEFRGTGEWEEKKLSTCLEKVIDYRGKAPPKADTGIPLITARNVRFGWLDMTNDEYIDEDKYQDWMTKGVPKAGDILFTTEAPLGNVALFPNSGRFALGQRIITLRTKTKKCLSEFLFQSLLGPRMQKEINFYSTGSTAKGIKSKVFVNIGFCYPGIKEQRCIADCLTSLDTQIEAQATKIEILKTHKRGLMQQLFPNAE